MHTRSRGLSTEPGYERQERNGERERERESVSALGLNAYEQLAHAEYFVYVFV